MKLPANSIIAPSKLTSYLLKRRDVDDKSKFLALAGYDINSAVVLERDIRALLEHNATLLEVTEYAEKFAIDGVLVGPNGRHLSVRSIWAKLHTNDETRFITLYPDHS